MAQPAQSDVHIDVALTNISVAYLQDPSYFIANQVFPVIPVDKQSDKYFVFDKNAWLRDQAQVRADSTESAGSGYTLSTGSYYCVPWALHKDIGDQVRANTDNPLNPDRNATQWLTQMMLLRQEIQFNTDFMKTSLWGTDSTPSNLWSDYTNSDPIGDIETGKDTVLGKTGFEVNTLVLGYTVFRYLKQHPDIVDRFKYTSSQSITPQMLAAMFDIDRVLIAKAVKATNAENETGVYAYTTGKNALLAHVAPAPGLEVPSAGYAFYWRGVSGGLGLPIGISSFRMPHLKSDRVEAEAAWNNVAVATDLGYYYNGAVA